MKRFISLLIILSLTISCMVGCKKDELKNNQNKNVQSTEQEVGTELDENMIGFSKFDSNLIEYLNVTNENENYMVSPLSLKLALTLLAAGAQTNTLDEILNVAEASSFEYYLEWAESISKLQEKEFKHEGDAFEIAYGIWHNSDTEGKFKDIYKDNLKELNTLFEETPGVELKNVINKWINEKTKGLIPELFTDSLEEHTNILVNTVYLKGAWQLKFDKYLTKENDFTTVDGEKVKKDFMNQIDDFDYYEDENSQVLIMELTNGFKAAFVLGDNSNIVKKIDKAKSTLVEVTLPKFEIESLFEDEIVEYLESEGMKTAFDEKTADFRDMMDVPTYVKDILQKTKLKVDENGLEAAAVTAVMMDNCTSLPSEPKNPVEFKADKPFKFYIFSDDESLESPELLFYGQYVK